MGYKKKWIDSSEDQLSEYFKRICEILKPLFTTNGIVDVDDIEEKHSLECLLGFIVNCKCASNDDGHFLNFGADYVTALHIEIEDNGLLKFWGRINWLSLPNDHECHNSNQDPFYGIFELRNNEFKLKEAMFGDYDKTDLDGSLWINQEITWMYDL